jgi:NitT/TauT family transport system substrate-binding protein
MFQRRRNQMSKRTSAVFLLALAAVLLALVAAGCAGDDDDESAGQEGGTTAATTGEEPRENVELTVTIPFPSGVAFYPLFVAEDRGYFEEEGLSVDVQPVDGSGATLQQLLAGSADVALPSPGPFMQGVARGNDLVSVYTLYQQNVFSVQTLADSDVQSLADLEGQTVGVGALDGGETPFVKAALSEEAGLEEGDYKLLAVGDGGAASVALRRGDVAAYAAAFPDVATMRLRGLDLRNLLPETFQSFFDSLVVVERSFVEDNPEAVAGLGRALAKATVWGMENPEGVLDITGKSFPEENEDRDFTLALLKETQSLYELPDGAESRWGEAREEAVERYMNFLVEQGELEQPVDTDIFVNDFVDQYNDFDEAGL